MSELSELDDIVIRGDMTPTAVGKHKRSLEAVRMLRIRAHEAGMRAQAKRAFYSRSGNTPSLPKFSWDNE